MTSRTEFLNMRRLGMQPLRRLLSQGKFYCSRFVPVLEQAKAHFDVHLFVDTENAPADAIGATVLRLATELEVPALVLAANDAVRWVLLALIMHLLDTAHTTLSASSEGSSCRETPFAACRWAVIRSDWAAWRPGLRHSVRMCPSSW